MFRLAYFTRLTLHSIWRGPTTGSSPQSSARRIQTRFQTSRAHKTCFGTRSYSISAAQRCFTGLRTRVTSNRTSAMKMNRTKGILTCSISRPFRPSLLQTRSWLSTSKKRLIASKTNRSCETPSLWATQSTVEMEITTTQNIERNLKYPSQTKFSMSFSMRHRKTNALLACRRLSRSKWIKVGRTGFRSTVCTKVGRILTSSRAVQT